MTIWLKQSMSGIKTATSVTRVRWLSISWITIELKLCRRDLCGHSGGQVPPLAIPIRSELIHFDARFMARVVEVFLPRFNVKVNGESTDAAPVASTSTFPHANDQCTPHQIHGDLKISAKEVNVADDPVKYLYKVQILEEEKPEGRDKHTASTKEARAKWNGSIMEVRCSVMRWASCVCAVISLDLLSQPGPARLFQEHTKALHSRLCRPRRCSCLSLDCKTSCCSALRRRFYNARGNTSGC